MSRLQYYVESAVEELRGSVDERLTWYFDAGAATRRIELLSANPVKRTDIEIGPLAGRLMTGRRDPSKDDAENAMIVYTALHDLTPHQASDERLWAYLCHHDCAAYVADRWLRRHSASDDDASNRVRNHFFASGNRALIRDNGVSRLWWLGYIAHQVDDKNPRQFLRILLTRQDVRSALIERPGVSRNYRVLRTIYAVMREDHATRQQRLFVRDTFREWMKRLNRHGGVVLLDAVPEDALERLVRDEADYVRGLAK